MAWRRGSRWLHLTTWVQWLIARNGKRSDQAIGWLSTRTFLTWPCALSSLPPLGTCNNCTPNICCARLLPNIWRGKWSVFPLGHNSWPKPWQDRRDEKVAGTSPSKSFDLLCPWYFVLLSQARAHRWERERTLSKSQLIYPLASQEELAVYPGMPNVQKIYLGKGSGKCMFLFYPK